MHNADRTRGTPRSVLPFRLRALGPIAACAGVLGLPMAALAGDDSLLGSRFTLSGVVDDEERSARTIRWSATADFWAPQVDGTFSLQGTPSSIDVGVFDGGDDDEDDEEDDGAIGFSLRADAAINRLVLFLGSSVAGAQDDQATFLGSTGEMNVGLAWFEFGGGFRFIDIAAQGEGVRPPGFSLDGLVGGRVTSVAAEFDPDIGGEIDGHHTWIEPFVGGQLAWRPVPGLTLKVLGDVGGFGAGSEFSWRAEATVGWTIQLARFNLNIHGGYRAIDQDFDNDSGDELSGWDGVVHGPIAGVTFEF